jgi:hypothetical protein
MKQENIKWVKNCITSCTNMDQLKTCEIIISLFKFRLLKDGASQQDAYLIESDLLETYINKEALLTIYD